MYFIATRLRRTLPQKLKQISGFFVLAGCLLLLGCSSDSTMEDGSAAPGETNQQSNTSSSNRSRPSLPVRKNVARNLEQDQDLANAISLARVMQRHEQYEKAEQLLEEAISNSRSGDKQDALALLGELNQKTGSTSALALDPSASNAETNLPDQTSSTALAQNNPATNITDASTTNEDQNPSTTPSTTPSATSSTSDSSTSDSTTLTQNSSLPQNLPGSTNAESGRIDPTNEPSTADTSNNEQSNSDPNTLAANKSGEQVGPDGVAVAPVSPVKTEEPLEPGAEVPVPLAPDTKLLESLASGSKIKATDRQLSNVISQARYAETAKDALAMIENFLSHHELDPKQEARLNPRLENWQERAKHDLKRLGSQWLSDEEIQSVRQDAHNQIDRGLSLLKIRDYDGAFSFFKQASKSDPSAIRADFTMGLVYAFAPHYDYERSKTHFEEVLDRVPQHLTALNNLALVEMKLGHFDKALQYWSEAASLSPSIPEITQNVGRLIDVANRKQIKLTQVQQVRFERLYLNMTQTQKGKLVVAEKGWYYLPLILTEKERLHDPLTLLAIADAKQKAEEQAKRLAEEAERQARRFGNNEDSVTPKVPTSATMKDYLAVKSGTGFVVARGYVLTHLGVIRPQGWGDMDKLMIVDPTDPRREKLIPATIVDVSETSNVAVLHCPALNANPVPLTFDLPAADQKLYMISHPQTNQTGREIHTVTSSFTMLSNQQTKRLVLFDATAFPGNRGALLTNVAGQAVGIGHISNHPGTERYMEGVTLQELQSFLQSLIPQIENEQAIPRISEPLQVERNVQNATVMIVSYLKASDLGIRDNTRRRSYRPSRIMRSSRTADEPEVEFTGYEDKSCPVCHGQTTVDCNVPQCSQGTITQKIAYRELVGIGRATQLVQKYRFVKQPCRKCKGKGKVECANCEGDGNDPLLEEIKDVKGSLPSSSSSSSR